MEMNFLQNLPELRAGCGGDPQNGCGKHLEDWRKPYLCHAGKRSVTQYLFFSPCEFCPCNAQILGGTCVPCHPASRELRKREEMFGGLAKITVKNITGVQKWQEFPKQEKKMAERWWKEIRRWRSLFCHSFAGGGLPSQHRHYESASLLRLRLQLLPAWQGKRPSDENKLLCSPDIELLLQRWSSQRTWVTPRRNTAFTLAVLPSPFKH